jgi:hypothetical protein
VRLCQRLSRPLQVVESLMASQVLAQWFEQDLSYCQIGCYWLGPHKPNRTPRRKPFCIYLAVSRQLYSRYPVTYGPKSFRFSHWDRIAPLPIANPVILLKIAVTALSDASHHRYRNISSAVSLVYRLMNEHSGVVTNIFQLSPICEGIGGLQPFSSSRS